MGVTVLFPMETGLGVSGDSEPIKNVFYSHNYIKCPSFKSKYKEMAVVLMIKVLDRSFNMAAGAWGILAMPME
jgi:hypothetical protein